MEIPASNIKTLKYVVAFEKLKIESWTSASGAFF